MVLLAVLAGSSASGATGPSSHASPRAVEVRSAKPHMSILARTMPKAPKRSGLQTLRPIADALGRMPAPSGKGGTAEAQPATTALGPTLALASTSGGVNVDGIHYSQTDGWDPPDTNGDVGPEDYVQIVNMNWEVFDKNGQSIGGPYPLNELWSKQSADDPCQSSPQGSPVVIYDQLADRWLLTYRAFERNPPVSGAAISPFYQCMAVSLTGDPLGYWWLYDFDITNVTKLADAPNYVQPGLPEFPKFGVWPDGWYMAANLAWPEGVYDHYFGIGIAFEKEAMMNGQYARARGFVPPQSETVYGILPANYEGDAAHAPPPGTPAPFVAPDSQAYRFRVYRFDPNWADPTNWNANPAGIQTSNEITHIDTSVCDGASRPVPCIDQPGTSVLLPTLDDDQLMYPANYRRFTGAGAHESLVFNQTINGIASDPGYATVQWYELRNLTSGTPTVYAQGSIPTTTTNRWAAAASIDQAGNIGIGYNISSFAATIYPGIRYAGRTAGAGAGALDVTEATLVNGSGYRSAPVSGGGIYWGRHSAMSVDPVDNCTFWFTGEYLAQTYNVTPGWDTRIGNFRIPDGACTDASVNEQPIASFTAPASITAGNSASFNASASSDPDGTIQSYDWDFDSDGTYDVVNGASSLSHQYDLAGTYFVTLRVTDNGNPARSATTTRTLTVNAPNSNAPPHDLRADPNDIAAGGKVQLSNVNATTTGETNTTCGSSQYGKTVWLHYHADGPGTLDLKTGGLDTVMSLYSGANTTPLTCNDDDAQQAPGPSHITRRVPAGDYLLQVGGFGAGGAAKEDVITVTANFTANVAPTAAFTNSSPAIAHHEVSFDAGGSSDSDGTIAKYEWDLDGNGSFETDTGTTKTTTRTYDSAGAVNVKLRVTDSDGATNVVAHDVTVANPAPPTAKLTFSPNPVLAGKTVTLDGSGSVDATHTITKYEWDLDGDGSYERDTGGSATTTNAYAAPGAYVIGLRVTDSDGLQGTASGTLTVTSPPDNNQLFGVTINNEATYTRTPKVTLSLRFPAGISAIIVSNDGGFLHPTTFEPKKDIDWELISTGPERLPKTVYVRFATGPFVGQNYTDDIILDEKPPVVEQAAVAQAASASSVAVRAAKLKKWKVKVKATDSNSGVGGVEITANKKKPGKWIPYKKKLTVKSAKKPKYVRARDKAGNVSGWKKAR